MGGFSELPVPTPVATIVNCLPESTPRIGSHRANPSRKQRISLFSQGLVGLASAVVLLGFACRLSHYHRHPGPTLRATVVKLWFEGSNASMTAASKLKSQLEFTSSPQALASAISLLPCLERTAYNKPLVHKGGVLSFDSPIPLRSPPPQ